MNIDEVKYAKLFAYFDYIMGGGLPLLEWNTHCGYLPSGELTFILELKDINMEKEGQSTWSIHLHFFSVLIFLQKY